MTTTTIFTLGTGNRSINEFIDILKKNKIQVVIDVRRFPTSRFEDFKKERLGSICKNEGIDYVHLGNELGGYRKGGYEEYTKTKDFQCGLNELLKFAQKKVVCIICAETLPWRCHRRFIGERLLEKGYRILHIIDGKRIWKT